MVNARRRTEREQGSITPFFVAGMIAFYILLGVIVDAGGKVQAAQRADAVAAEAARAGAQMIATDTLVDGSPPLIDAAGAAGAANAYLTAAGMTGNVQVSGSTITVTTTDTFEPIFLSAVGIGGMEVGGQATIELTRVG